MRGGGLMWLLGAGASAAAGIPTAWDMIWEFKQQLYVSQRRVSPKVVADLANPAVQRDLQAFVDGLEKYPPAGAPDEYAALFEAAYSNESDRRAYIAGKLSGAKPSYGHIALATLMRGDRARLVWTTNFDPLVADGCAKVYDGTGHLTTVTLESAELGREVVNESRWPAEIKLHGDFRSRRPGLSHARLGGVMPSAGLFSAVQVGDDGGLLRGRVAVGPVGFEPPEFAALALQSIQRLAEPAEVGFGKLALGLRRLQHGFGLFQSALRLAGGSPQDVEVRPDLGQHRGRAPAAGHRPDLAFQHALQGAAGGRPRRRQIDGRVLLHPEQAQRASALVVGAAGCRVKPSRACNCSSAASP